MPESCNHARVMPGDTRQNDALWTRVLLAMVGLFVGLTQWVVLSEPDVHPWCGASRAGPGRGVDGADGAIQPLRSGHAFVPTTQRAREVRIQYFVVPYVDGFPITVCRPQNQFLARLLNSGKYKQYVVKGEYVIAIGPGFPINYTGPHIGVKHDSPMWKDNLIRRAKLYKWEYGLGDKAYVGCPELLTEYKKPPASAKQHAGVTWRCRRVAG